MSPRFDVEVMGLRRRVPVTAVVDTGFDGYLCLPTAIAVGLGLELVGEALVELADGSEKIQLVFAGSVNFLGKVREVDIYVTQSDDALLGTALLADCRMVIDFPADSVRIAAKRPRGHH